MPESTTLAERTLQADIAELEEKLTRVLELSHVSEEKRAELTALLRRIKERASGA